MTTKSKPTLHVADADQIAGVEAPETEATATTVKKPGAFTLDRFKTKRAAAIANVETLPTALPHHGIAQAKDFVRLHPDEDEYWSDELCFVSVPIVGAKTNTLHLIAEELAERHLPSAKIQRFRLALATKPYDVFFLAHVPTRNLDNSWNATNLQACRLSQAQWVQLSSRREEGIDNYKIDFARDPEAFPKTKWLTQTLAGLIELTYAGFMIVEEQHPGLLRLIGAKQLT